MILYSIVLYFVEPLSFMPKRPHFSKSTLVILFSYIFVLVLWEVLDIYFFYPLFSHLSADKITDLSKTLIQSIGIFVGLVVAAGFFYISRSDELGVRVLSRAYDQLEKIEMAIMERKKTTRILEECKIQLTSLSGSLKNSDKVGKTSLEEKLNKIEKAFDETGQTLKGLQNSNVRPILGEFQNLENYIITLFAFDIALFLASVLVAIVSYVSLDGRLLDTSFALLFFGIALLFMVWLVSYEMSSVARGLFESVLRFNVALRMTLIDDRELRDRRDELVNEIKDACTKTKS